MNKIKGIFILLLVAITWTSGCTDETDPINNTASRTDFLGSWSVTESWTRLSYEVTITADPGSSDGVFISNFANTGFGSTPAGAVVSGKKITLDPNQVISGITINGSGTLSGTTINWEYTLNDGADLINATAVYTKK